MRQRKVTLLLAFVGIIGYVVGIPISGDGTLIIPPNKPDGNQVTPSEPTTEKPLEPIQMYSMKVISEVSARYAHTVVSSRVANPANKAQEVTFSVLLPDTAFISGFLMDIDGKVYEAYVKEKEEAKKIYQQAVESGIAAAHVAASARDSNHFTVSVNVEANSKATFNLTYEELLTRRLGVYNDIINLNPGQIVKDLSVVVHIKENRPITTLKVIELRSGNEIDEDENTKENKLAAIEQSENHKEATIRFSPTAEQQKELIDIFREKLRVEREKNKESENYYYNPYENNNQDKEDGGINGQFVVQYDVERDPHNGEVLVYDGYFAHFFAPTDLTPLEKHAVFVLDVSGSMSGRKMEQLKEAMLSILDNLNKGDYFSIIEFDSTVKVYDVEEPSHSVIYGFENVPSWYGYEERDKELQKNSPPPLPSEVTPENIQKAKKLIKDLEVKDSTNIDDALKTAIKVVKEGVRPIAERTEKVIQSTSQIGKESDTNTNESKSGETKEVSTHISEKKVAPEPIIIFLTDGDANVGESDSEKIIAAVDELNSGEKKAAIFSLGFGEGADRSLLQKLSVHNNGFFRHIYEAADAAQQLSHFYQEISSPLLAGIKFVYPPDQVEEESITKDKFHVLFLGGEIIVAGKLKDSNVQELTPTISATSQTGLIDFDTKVVKDDAITVPDIDKPKKRFEPTERLWAYLRIKQLLDQIDEKKSTVSYSYPGDSTTSTTTTTTTEKSLKEETPKEKALALALKYSFVTPLTSLVVVKPNDTSSAPVGAEAADRNTNSGGGYLSTPINNAQFAAGFPAPAAYPASSFAFGGAIPAMAEPVYDYDTVVEKFETIESDKIFSTEFTPETTLTPKANQYGLEAYPWLQKYIVEELDQLELPINDTTVVLKLEVDESKLSADDPPCDNSESGKPGVCKYITSCTTSTKALESLDTFSKYYCSRHGYAGVCCSEDFNKSKS